MTQEQLAYMVDRAPRTIMYNENDGQHPSLNTFYQLVTMFDISVDQYFYPSKNTEYNTSVFFIGSSVPLSKNAHNILHSPTNRFCY